MGIQAAIPLQRSRGEVRLSFKQRGNATVLDELYQSGSGKIKMARAEPDRLKEAVIINTTGGLTDGDEFISQIRWRKNTTGIITTQAAERIYKSRLENAKIHSRLQIDSGACAMWLPQETILFDCGRVKRSNEVEVSSNGELIAVETAVFGRAAMGETVEGGFFSDNWQIRVDDKLVLADRFQLEDDIQAQLDGRAIANGARALATIINVATEAEAHCANIREIIMENKVIGGTSSLGALTITRLFAKNAYELRTATIPILELLMKHASPDHAGSLLPRVWRL